MTARRTTTTKTAATEVQTEPIADDIKVAEVKPNTVKEKATKTAVKANKTYSPDDEILCRSVTSGELILIGKKTGNRYIWSNVNDEMYVLYQDLQSLKVTRSSYLYDPNFIILDEELVEQWTDLKDVYNQLLKIEDITALLSKTPEEIKSVLATLPKGLLERVKAIISDKIVAGEFDSILRIRAIDEALDTDFASTIN